MHAALAKDLGKTKMETSSLVPLQSLGDSIDRFLVPMRLTPSIIGLNPRGRCVVIDLQPFSHGLFEIQIAILR
jgi:hypothetical protein